MTSGHQRLECFIATLPTYGVYGRLVHLAETFNRFADFGLWIAHDKNAFGSLGSARNRWGSYSSSPRSPIAVIREKGRE